MKNASSEEIRRRQAFARILSWQYFRLFQQNRSKAVRFRLSKCFLVCASKQTQGVCEYTATTPFWGRQPLRLPSGGFIFVGRYGAKTSVANPHHCKRGGCALLPVSCVTAKGASFTTTNA